MRGYYKVIGFILFLLSFLFPLQAQALTPAGTVIGNVATATYYDKDNNKYTTTSNIVQTKVQEICGVDVSGGGEKEGVPSQTVYIPFIVANRGNGENTFELEVKSTGDKNYDKTIYLDKNQNGIVDPGENEVKEITLGVGESSSVVVAVKIPTDAEERDEDSFYLEASGKSPSGCSDRQNAKVKVVSDAMVQINKSVDKDVASSGDVLTYTLKFKNVGTQPAKAVVVNINNKSKEGIIVYDKIPEGTIFKEHSAEGSPVQGQVVYSEDDDGENWSTTEPVAGKVKYVGFFIPDDNPTDGQKKDVLAVDQEGYLSFKVQVDKPTTEKITNEGFIKYSGTSGDKEAGSNLVTTTVSAASLADIAVGALANDVSSVEDDSEGDYKDDNTLSKVPAGTWIEFKHSAANRSTVKDVIELTVDSSKDETNLPSGATVEFWNADGSAKLIDTDGDGKVDLGTLEPGTKKDFTVKVFIPATAEDKKYFLTVVASSGLNPSEIDRSRDNIDGVIGPGVDIGRKGSLTDSLNDPSDGNTNPNQGNKDSDDIRESDNGDVANNIVNPGETAIYQLEIANTGSSQDQFSLKASGNPEGTKVSFYLDKDCSGNYRDGQLITETPLLGASLLTREAKKGDTTLYVYGVSGISSGDTLIVGAGTDHAEEVTVDSVNTVTNVISLAAPLKKDHAGGEKVSEKVCIIMTATTSETTPPGESNLVIEAESTLSEGKAKDSLDAYLKVNPVCKVVISPEHSDQLAPGGTTTYQHTLYNKGNVKAKVTVSIPKGKKLSYVILDKDGNVKGTSYAIDNLLPGKSIDFYVKVSAPSDVPPGTVEQVEVLASSDIDNDGNKDCSSSVIDSTTIIEGFLQLKKSVDKSVAAPGDVLTYTIEYKNIGDRDALDVVITDPIPDHTVFVKDAFGTDSGLCYDKDCDGNCTAGEVKTNASGDDEAEYDANNNLVRFRVGDGADSSKGGKVAPGKSGCIIFKVKIK